MNLPTLVLIVPFELVLKTSLGSLVLWEQMICIHGWSVRIKVFATDRRASVNASQDMTALHVNEVFVPITATTEVPVGRRKYSLIEQGEYIPSHGMLLKTWDVCVIRDIEDPLATNRSVPLAPIL